MNKYHLLITCEHAGNVVPASYAHLFTNAARDLESHKGWDPGAWDIALHLGTAFKQEPIGIHTTRLLIELNRSLFHPQLFSEYSQSLSTVEKENLIRDIYLPYRNRIEEIISKSPKPILHLSIHSFTPVWNGQIREVDIGLLFDPDRKMESAFCELLKREIDNRLAAIQCKFNDPYKGIDDGFTTYLRGKFSDPEYLGIEIEVNQKFIGDLEPIKSLITESLHAILIE